MAAEWFCKISGKTLGPLSPQQMKALAKKGQLSAEHKVRQGADGSWIPASRVKGLIPEKPEKIARAKPLKEKQPAPKRPAKAKPAVRKTATSLPVAKPAPKPPHDAPPPVARPVASQQPGSGQFGIATGDEGSIARAGGRRYGGRRRQRKNIAVIVSLVLLVVGLAGAGGVLFYTGAFSSPPVAGGTSNTSSSTPMAEAEGAAKPAAAAASPKDVNWIDAETAQISCGDVKVRVVSAIIDSPRLVGRNVRPKRRFLLVGLQLSNSSTTKIKEYTSWNARAAKMPLTDNLGNPYTPRFSKSFGGAEIAGQVERESIYPGKSIEDMLVFQEPVDSPRLEYLRLTLPAEVLGEPGNLHFQIPASMIERAPAEPATKGPAEPGAAADPADVAGEPEGNPFGGADNEDLAKPPDAAAAPVSKPPAGENSAPNIFDDEPGLRGDAEPEPEGGGLESDFKEKFGPKPEEPKQPKKRLSR